MINNLNPAGAEVAEKSSQQEVKKPAQNSTENSSSDDFGALLENFESQSTIMPGEIVEGRVIKVSDRGVIIDIGFKSEGIVAVEEFTDSEGKVSVKPGDQVAVMVKQIENPEGYVELSRAEAVHLQRWDAIEKAYNTKETIK